MQPASELCCLIKIWPPCHRRRVPEALLLAFAACFGSAGVLAGMLIGHHKTRKPLFTVTVPVLLLAQGAGLYLLFGH